MAILPSRGRSGDMGRDPSTAIVASNLRHKLADKCGIVELCTLPVIFLLYLFSNVVVLDVRLYTLSQAPPQAPSTTSPALASPPANTIILSTNTQQCITQYTLNAPGNPTRYPCDMCLPLLALVPLNATAYYAVARDATQFCGLRSIWEDGIVRTNIARLDLRMGVGSKTYVEWRAVQWRWSRLIVVSLRLEVVHVMPVSDY